MLSVVVQMAVSGCPSGPHHAILACVCRTSSLDYTRVCACWCTPGVQLAVCTNHACSGAGVSQAGSPHKHVSSLCSHGPVLHPCCAHCVFLQISVLKISKMCVCARALFNDVFFGWRTATPPRFAVMPERAALPWLFKGRQRLTPSTV